MKTLALRLAGRLALVALVCIGLVTPAFAIFPLIVPQVSPEVVIEPQDPPVPNDIPNVPDVPTAPCDCDCEPNISSTPEPATMVTALVGVAIGGAYVLRKKLAK